MKKFPAMLDQDCDTSCDPFERKALTIGHLREKIRPLDLSQGLDRALEKKCFSIFLEIFLEAGAIPSPSSVQKAIDSPYPLSLTLALWEGANSEKLNPDNFIFDARANELGVDKSLKKIILEAEIPDKLGFLEVIKAFKEASIPSKEWKGLLKLILSCGGKLNFDIELIGWMVKTFTKQSALEEAFAYFEPLYLQYLDFAPFEKKICRDAIEWKKRNLEFKDLEFKDIEALIKEAASYSSNDFVIKPSVVAKHLEESEKIFEAKENARARFDREPSLSNVTVLLASRKDFAEGIAEALKSNFILLKRLIEGEELSPQGEQIEGSTSRIVHYFDEPKQHTIVHMLNKSSYSEGIWFGVEVAGIYKEGQLSIPHAVPLFGNLQIKNE